MLLRNDLPQETDLRRVPETSERHAPDARAGAAALRRPYDPGAGAAKGAGSLSDGASDPSRAESPGRRDSPLRMARFTHPPRRATVGVSDAPYITRARGAARCAPLTRFRGGSPVSSRRTSSAAFRRSSTNPSTL